MIDFTGYVFIDGIDLWTAFNIMVEEGSAEFLRWPPKKESISHNWKDRNGIDVDLSRFFFSERQGSLRMGMIADNEDSFWQKHEQLIATLTQPGTRRLEFKSHGSRSYFVYYKECNSWTQVKALKGDGGVNIVAAKFAMTIVEPEPQIDPSNIYIVDEEGRFLIT
jgi:hypothetical protein